MKLLEILDLSHSFGEEILFEKSELTLNKGECLGVVGENGAGKSTLIKICSGEIYPDKGYINWRKKVKKSYLNQTVQIDSDLKIIDFLRLTFKDLFELEKKMNKLYSKCVDCNSREYAEASLYQSKLEYNDYYSIENRIERVAFGLGIDSLGFSTRISDLSSGQRVKLILARLLLENADVILLDEPTNFLDENHISWLANYIVDSNKSFIIVSHDFNFMGNVATSICCLERKQLKKYYCSFKDFLKKREHLKKEYNSSYKKQQEYIRKTEEYIRKNKAGVKCKNARGRGKQLNRIVKLRSPLANNIKPSFSFKESLSMTKSNLEIKDLSIGYNYSLLSGINFVVNGGEKVLIKGFNGVGKTTLLKTLMSKVNVINGRFKFSRSVLLGYSDENIIASSLDLTVMQFIKNIHPKFNKSEVMKFVHRSGLISDKVDQLLGSLSGGELAKIKLSLLTFKPCNFLILDEPTNHLDYAAKEALKEALISFRGSILLVSHEKKFYENWIDKIIDLGNMVCCE